MVIRPPGVCSLISLFSESYLYLMRYRLFSHAVDESEEPASMDPASQVPYPRFTPYVPQISWQSVPRDTCGLPNTKPIVSYPPSLP